MLVLRCKSALVIPAALSLLLYTYLKMRQGQPVFLSIVQPFLRRLGTNIFNFRFITGHAILIGTVFMSFCLTAFMTLYLRQENSRRDALAREAIGSLSTGEERALEEIEKGDGAASFRYTV